MSSARFTGIFERATTFDLVALKAALMVDLGFNSDFWSVLVFVESSSWKPLLLM